MRSTLSSTALTALGLTLIVVGVLLALAGWGGFFLAMDTVTGVPHPGFLVVAGVVSGAIGIGLIIRYAGQMKILLLRFFGGTLLIGMIGTFLVVAFLLKDVSLAGRAFSVILMVLAIVGLYAVVTMQESQPAS